MRKLAASLAVLLLTAGCFEIEQSINLKKDLSGTADFHLGVDMEPMVIVMAQFAKEMEGKKGPLTEAEIAKAKADFKKSKKSTTTTEEKPSDRADFEKSLPEGVKLLDFGVKEHDFGVATDMKFGFDRISHLVGVKLPQKEGADPTQKNVIDSPFEGLELIEQGNTITLRTKPQNPTENVKEAAGEDAPKLDPETEEMIKKAFSKLRVSYRITAPFTIVSHNATRREGDTLIWDFDLATFEKMAKEKKLDDMAVHVTYKR